MTGADSITDETMRGNPPRQLSCGQCGERIGASVTLLRHHYEIAHGWRITPGMGLPVVFHQVRFRRLRRWLRQCVGLVG